MDTFRKVTLYHRAVDPEVSSTLDIFQTEAVSNFGRYLTGTGNWNRPRVLLLGS